jgi:hypothetical protein
MMQHQCFREITIGWEDIQIFKWMKSSGYQMLRFPHSWLRMLLPSSEKYDVPNLHPFLKLTFNRKIATEQNVLQCSGYSLNQNLTC